MTSPFPCCVLPNFISSKHSAESDSRSSPGAESDSRYSAESNSGLELPCARRSINTVTKSETNSSTVDGLGTSSSPVAGEMRHREQDIGDVEVGLFLKDLVTELLMLKFYEKNNDLYQFHQVRNS